MAGGRLIWAHGDSVDMHGVAELAFAAAHGRDTWPDTASDGNRLVRAWLASYAAAIAGLGPKPLNIVPEGSTLPLGMQIDSGAKFAAEILRSNDPKRFEIQNTMSYALAALAAHAQGDVGPEKILLPDATITRIRTHDGDPPIPITTKAVAENTGQIGIVEGVVIVACVGLVAGAVGWIASQVNEVHALGLQADSKAKVAVEAMSKAAEIVEAHTQAEAQAGKTIEFSAPELDILSTLKSTITTTANWTPPQLQSVPNVASATQKIGSGMGWGTIALFAAGAALLLWKGRN